jgi:hypothetical protein
MKQTGKPIQLEGIELAPDAMERLDAPISARRKTPSAYRDDPGSYLEPETASKNPACPNREWQIKPVTSPRRCRNHASAPTIGSARMIKRSP